MWNILCRLLWSAQWWCTEQHPQHISYWKKHILLQSLVLSFQIFGESSDIKMERWGAKPYFFFFIFFNVLNLLFWGPQQGHSITEERSEAAALCCYCFLLLPHKCVSLWKWCCCGRKAVTDCGCGSANIINSLSRLCQQCRCTYNLNQNLSLITLGTGCKIWSGSGSCCQVVESRSPECWETLVHWIINKSFTVAKKV